MNSRRDVDGVGARGCGEYRCLRILANLAAAYLGGESRRGAPAGTQRDAKTVRDTFADASDGVDLLWTTNEEIQIFAASDLLRAADFITVTQFADPAISGGARDGTVYGVPIATGNNLLLYYNKKLLKDPPQDTDALVRLGASLTKEASGQYALVYDTTDPFWLLPWIGAMGVLRLELMDAPPT